MRMSVVARYEAPSFIIIAYQPCIRDKISFHALPTRVNTEEVPAEYLLIYTFSLTSACVEISALEGPCQPEKCELLKIQSVPSLRWLGLLHQVFDMNHFWWYYSLYLFPFVAAHTMCHVQLWLLPLLWWDPHTHALLQRCCVHWCIGSCWSKNH